MIKNNKFYLSASGISLFAESPKKFYLNYFGKDSKKDDKEYVEGALVHTLLLEPDNYNKKFAILSTKLSLNLKMVAEEIIDKEIVYQVEDGIVVQNEKLFDTIIKLTKDLDYYLAIKDTEKRYLKLMKEGLNEFLIHYDKIRGKKLITQELYDKCQGLVATILEDESISNLLTFKDENIEIFTELHLDYDSSNRYGTHGYIDHLKIDHKNKTIYLTDVKTTSKHISKFVYEIKNLKYDLKISHYVGLVFKYLEDLFANDYKLEVRFVVIDCHGHVIDFLISEDTLFKYLNEYKILLEELDEHFSRNYWRNPKYYKSTIIL